VRLKQEPEFACLAALAAAEILGPMELPQWLNQPLARHWGAGLAQSPALAVLNCLEPELQLARSNKGHQAPKGPRFRAPRLRLRLQQQPARVPSPSAQSFLLVDRLR
jgi:hypothetical protein